MKSDFVLYFSKTLSRFDGSIFESLFTVIEDVVYKNCREIVYALKSLEHKGFLELSSNWSRHFKFQCTIPISCFRVGTISWHSKICVFKPFPNIIYATYTIHILENEKCSTFSDVYLLSCLFILSYWLVTLHAKQSCSTVFSCTWRVIKKFYSVTGMELRM